MQSAILAWRQGLFVCDSDLEDPALPSLPSTVPTPICSSGQSEDLSTTVDGPDHHLTQPKTSSPAASISIAFDGTQAPRPRSEEELYTEVRRLELTRELLQRELDKSKANLDAMETYRRILMKQVASYATSQMDLQTPRRRSRRPVKTSARYFVYPRDFEEEEHFAADQQEKECFAKEAAEKAARKVAEDVAHEAQLREVIRTRVFSGGVSRCTLIHRLIFSQVRCHRTNARTISLSSRVRSVSRQRGPSSSSNIKSSLTSLHTQKSNSRLVSPASSHTNGVA
jgi:hypothetical protein